ncbi:hypothetical protein AAVH_37982 [Aphelenchoides avenae]|nr:hypothetical protein AAVH_37982 [Aphelenchus avenae]
MLFAKLSIAACFLVTVAARPQLPGGDDDGANKALYKEKVFQWFSSLPQAQQDQIKAIFSDPSATKAQIKEKIQQRAVLTAFPFCQQQAKEINEKVQQKIQQLIQRFESKQLSPSAKQTFDELKGIVQNDNITPQQECEQIIGKLKSASSDDRKSLGVPENFDFDCSKIGQFMQGAAGGLPGQQALSGQ